MEAHATFRPELIDEAVSISGKHDDLLTVGILDRVDSGCSFRMNTSGCPGNTSFESSTLCVNPGLCQRRSLLYIRCETRICVIEPAKDVASNFLLGPRREG